MSSWHVFRKHYNVCSLYTTIDCEIAIFCVHMRGTIHMARKPLQSLCNKSLLTQL